MPTCGRADRKQQDAVAPHGVTGDNRIMINANFGRHQRLFNGIDQVRRMIYDSTCGF
jgi:hypothetical protein